MSVCPVCSTPVPPKPVGQRGEGRTYCSKPCRNRAQKHRERGKLPHWDRSPRPCESCGVPYLPHTEHQRFCRPRCRKKFENQRRYGGSGSSSNYYRLLFVEERGGYCERCGVTEDLEIHHIVSVAAGGLHRAANVEVVCAACHEARHGKPNAEVVTFHADPSLYPAIEQAVEEEIQEAWPPPEPED